MQDCHDPPARNVLQVPSSPASDSDDTDLAIVNVAPSTHVSNFIDEADLDDNEPIDFYNHTGDNHNDDDGDDDDDILITETRHTSTPPVNNSNNSGGDDIEITNVHRHPGPPPPSIPMFNPITGVFEMDVNAANHRPSSNSLPLRSFARLIPHATRANRRDASGRRTLHRRRPTPSLPFEVLSRLASNSSFSVLAALRAQHLSGGGPLPPFFPSEASQLEWALLTSAELYETGVAASAPSPEVKTVPVPTTVTPGYTRSIDPKNTYICAWCECEFSTGIPPKPSPSSDTNIDNDNKTNDDTHDNTTAQDKLAQWASRFGGTTQTDVDLSKRVFFAPCSHVYCGWCVKRIISRPKGKKQKRPKRTKTDKDGGETSFEQLPIIASCCVQGCKKAFRGKFTELYC